MAKVVGIGITLLLVSLLLFIMNSFRPRVRFNETSHPMLPSTATKICSFYQSFWPYRVLECDIPEKDFETLCASKEWNLNEIATPIEIRRFLAPLRVKNFAIPTEYKTEPSIKRIDVGQFYQSAVEPDGGNTCIAYDRAADRAFFYFGGR